MVHDRVFGRSSAFSITDVDEIKIVRGWRRIFGSLKFLADSVRTPDGNTPIKIHFVGVRSPETVLLNIDEDVVVGR